MSEQSMGARSAPSDRGWVGGAGTEALRPYGAVPPRRRRGLAFVASGIGVAVAVAVATVAIATLGEDRPTSPEAAVEAMFAAVEDQDVLGVLDSIAPGERAAVQPFVEDVVEELQRLEVLADDLDLATVDGFDLAVRDLVLSSRQLAEGIAVVTIEGGTLSSTVRPAEIPLGPLVRDFLKDGSSTNLEAATTSTELISGDPVDLVVIDDGGWHISIGYTLAELARADAGAPLPDFSAGLVPAGADSPEETVGELFAAAAALDVARLLTLTAPGEMSALHHYAPLFLDDAAAAVAELRATADLDLTVDRLETEVDRDGDTAVVEVTAFALSGQADGEELAVSFDGTCVVVESGEVAEEQCLDDRDGPAAGSVLTSQLGTTRLVVVRVDGEWFLSPTRTVLEQGLTVLRVLEPADLRDPAAFLIGVLGIDPFLFAGLAEHGSPGSGSAAIAGAPGGSSTWAVPDGSVGAGSRPEGIGAVGTCVGIYDELPDDATDEEWERADVAVDECLELAGAG